MGAIRRFGSLAVAVGGAIGARSVLRKRAWIEANVAADLRSPLLYAIPSLGSDRTLRVLRAVSKVAGRAGSSTAVETRTTADGVRVLVYEPASPSGSTGALLWIHGGGLVLGQAEQADEWCRRVRDELGVVVVNVDYRLAPDHPFPAPLDDCMSALRWLHDEAASLGVDPARVAIGGDSAGGGLAAAVCQRALDEGGASIAFQLLVYPMLDDRTVLRTDLDPAVLFTWSPTSNRYGWTSYLGHPPTAAPTPPHAVPGRRADLAGLPPAWIGVGDLDLFHDEDVDYAGRLEASGVACDLHVVPGMWHGADSIIAAPSMEDFRQRMVDALRPAIA